MNDPADARLRQWAAIGVDRDQFLALSLDMLCVSSADGYFKWLNAAFTDTLGWTTDELLAQPYTAFVRPDDLDKTIRKVERKVYLPRSSAKEGADERSTVEGTAETGGSETILMVEDDKLVREHGEQLLKSLGYRVVVASTGAEAIAMLKTHELIDLLFTDVVMRGGMNGRELADQAAALRPSLPVLFTSGYTQNANVHHGRLDEGVHLLKKPYRRRDLAAKLRQLLGPR